MQKLEKKVEKRKAKAIAAKLYRAGKLISLSRKEKGNDKSDTRDKIYPN